MQACLARISLVIELTLTLFFDDPKDVALRFSLNIHGINSRCEIACVDNCFLLGNQPDNIVVFDFSFN